MKNKIYEYEKDLRPYNATRYSLYGNLRSGKSRGGVEPLLSWKYVHGNQEGCMIPDTDKAYIAGLFDGEGSIYFAKKPEKKKKHKGKGYRISNSQRISMEITMTDQSVIRWVHDVLGCGTVVKKPRKGLRKDGTKYLMQWKWRCTFRDAYYVCCLIWPWSHTKLEKINQILAHYDEKILDNNVIDLEKYRNAR